MQYAENNKEIIVEHVTDQCYKQCGRKNLKTSLKAAVTKTDRYSRNGDEEKGAKLAYIIGNIAFIINRISKKFLHIVNQMEIYHQYHGKTS